MIKRTTIEIDEKLLAHAKHLLALRTNRATIEESLRRVVEDEENRVAVRAKSQADYLQKLGDMVEVDILAEAEMWR